MRDIGSEESNAGNAENDEMPMRTNKKCEEVLVRRAKSKVKENGR